MQCVLPLVPHRFSADNTTPGRLDPFHYSHAYGKRKHSHTIRRMTQ